jgi:hypothetical protein
MAGRVSDLRRRGSSDCGDRPLLEIPRVSPEHSGSVGSGTGRRIGRVADFAHEHTMGSRNGTASSLGCLVALAGPDAGTGLLGRFGGYWRPRAMAPKFDRSAKLEMAPLRSSRVAGIPADSRCPVPRCRWQARDATRGRVLGRVRGDECCHVRQATALRRRARGAWLARLSPAAPPRPVLAASRKRVGVAALGRVARAA